MLSPSVFEGEITELLMLLGRMILSIVLMDSYATLLKPRALIELLDRVALSEPTNFRSDWKFFTLRLLGTSLPSSSSETMQTASEGGGALLGRLPRSSSAACFAQEAATLFETVSARTRKVRTGGADALEDAGALESVGAITVVDEALMVRLDMR
jgi:hypothetical protein